MSSITRIGLLLLCVCCMAGQAPETSAPPSTWQPSYWETTLREIEHARERGDRMRAENLCSRAIPYVERQAIKALHDYAALLDSQQAGSGSGMRTKAEALARAKEEQRKATKPGNTYLGFVPWDELARYADALTAAQRESDAQAIRALAAAYKYTQEVYINRSLLMLQGKDPRGEC